MSIYDAILRSSPAECGGCRLSDPNGVPMSRCPFYACPERKPAKCPKRVSSDVSRLPFLIGLYSDAPRSGKSTVADILWQQHRYRVESFAAPLKGAVRSLLYSVGLSELEVDHYAANGKEDIIPAVGRSYRHLCQTLGTEWGREQVNPDFWVNTASAALHKSTQGVPVVFDDVRFANEAEAILKYGGQVWEVKRPGVSPSSQHPSEGGLRGWDFQRVISNYGTLRDLHHRVDEALYGFE